MEREVAERVVVERVQGVAVTAVGDAEVAMEVASKVGHLDMVEKRESERWAMEEAEEKALVKGVAMLVVEVRVA